MPTSRLIAAAALSALASAACASAPAARTAGTPASAVAADSAGAGAAGSERAGALAAFVGKPLVIVPAQRLRVAPNGPVWAPQGDEARVWLAALDDEIAAALGDRGVSRGWVLPAQVVRSARRNPSFASDPHALGVDPILPVAKPVDFELPDPLRSQLRAITALSEDARYVLVPVEVRFERVAPASGAASGVGVTAPSPQTDTRGRAVLHLAIVDTRLARVAWAGDVASDGAASLTPAVAASLADRVANLAGPPPR